MNEIKRSRRTLWSHGRKGESDWMRVLVDTKDDRVVVKYKDVHGITRRTQFANDKRGRDDAVVWAKAYRDEIKRLGGPRTATTHAQLWQAYIDSPAWRDLRDTSKPSYTDRWRRWVNRRGATTRPDDTTLHHVDGFIMASIGAGIAVNQIRNVLSVARLVYNWGQSRKLITENVLAGYRWKRPKDTVVAEPAEYTEQEFGALLAATPAQHRRSWRAHVALMIGGHHGGRARAVLNLTWDDIVNGELVWPAEFQKNGKAHTQPLTWDMVAALETARYWRRVFLYRGPWVLFGGTTASRGEVRELDEWMKDPAHKRVGRGKKPPRAIADRPYSYQGLYSMLRQAENDAGIVHRPYRAFHGMRKLAAGNVAERTGDARLALEWINDDIRMADRYLKKRDGRMERAAAAAGTQEHTKQTVPEVSAANPTENPSAVTPSKPST